MAFNLTPQQLQNLQNLTRLRRIELQQQSVALHQPQSNAAAANVAAQVLNPNPGNHPQVIQPQVIQPQVVQTQVVQSQVFQPQLGPPTGHHVIGTPPRRRRRLSPAVQRMINDVGPHNQQNRRAFKAWYRGYKSTLRANLGQAWDKMSDDMQSYGVSNPENFVVESGRDELQDILQVLPIQHQLALFDVAMERQMQKGDISSGKVAVFNSIVGRPNDLPLATS
ncbi:hypothetical protein J7T55_013127 [Diaporthe amygdali]|uniref:uncharacterized protein n=1 Tax=Phomopsis amygdali TaxID=1214568 RepID=UPI0022FE6C0A|nr:uncharacterized protein J7T55_013127 [Diaporthe amygdali]KAJ0118871.1 hypothetical protein J7T55_013127 [Diaporthe amygdali]